ncbi:MAG: apolipoprotein N-acyltransferase [Candidatus Schekmanbacteria bacterium]|nr:apolipoprotein N-acyltransferase [Candidatus Schekmanbacteria bacterium]
MSKIFARGVLRIPLPGQCADLEQLAAAVLSGVLLSFSFAGPAVHPLAFVAFVPLLWSCERLPPRAAFMHGWACGVSFFAISLSWLIETIRGYTSLDLLLSSTLILLLALVLGVFPGAATVAAQLVARRFAATAAGESAHRTETVVRALLFPWTWVASEYLRAWIMGFGWNSVGYSQYRALPIIQVADVGGVYLVSAVLVCANCALYSLLRVPGWRARLGSAAIPALVVGAALGYGQLRLQQVVRQLETAPQVSVAVVQNNIEQHTKWLPQMTNVWVSRQLRLTRTVLAEAAAAKARIDVIIWPEGAVTVDLDRDNAVRRRVTREVASLGAHLVLGAGATARSSDAPTNTVFHISPDGRIVNRYDKIRLVPFGEYVPYQSILFFVKKMVWQPAEFAVGEEFTKFHINGARLSPYICYETAFPELLRQFVAGKEGARMLVNVTNDAWFGASWGPEQHWAMTALRAVENRVPIARAAQTGISGFVSATGEILMQGPRFVEGAWWARLGLGVEPSLYTRAGDVFAIVVTSLMLAVTGLTALRRPAN